MILLAIDTSAIASAALLRWHDGDAEAALLAQFATEDTKSHAEVLAPGIRALLDEQGLTGAHVDRIVVGVGPGPFTGLRSGIATARALAFAWDVPLGGLMSLDAVAWDVVASGSSVQTIRGPRSTPASGETDARPLAAPSSDFLVATDARRREVYWGRYTASGALLDGPHVAYPDALPPLPAYGAGAGIYGEKLAAAGAVVVPGFERAQPTAASLGLAAVERLARGQALLDTAPRYLRESDAQVPGPRKKAL
ncbi:tRNA (adenosine(37)-N6)-threonylcarbamoyltransferase complex dimerization subunit type 1 TsaB [Sinomonas sp. ASV322]|uniref:tRNA (adenosine(37)-N6)-threonylcarbamoyltransferase complex dimerization subunit type 1 TsaB n=1 Tax=Sinomonas sp. ASV322 TaxID=3041920 RepID=UPI0027DAD630|nr:tRNA (adenosine(37)-N6)-threonylcarbamoyltransferase complex dimerization subunit type 1 TsaB [Sinomonas sp. ASV322]MDQ4501932.1 tRNA (adenosine(37)-N6)-threonylcarbamoyltransferase complex dimerization subunit type 1 TsaB [Sinomonas sp. ASV322]